MTRTEAKLNDAVEQVIKGYEEELFLYSAMRDVCAVQLATAEGADEAIRLDDLLDEKEDILTLIDQVDSAMAGAKSAVMSVDPDACPRREMLDDLLDRLACLIEDIRAIERLNIAAVDRRPRMKHPA